MSDVWPTALTFSNEGRVLDIRFDDGTAFAISAELLRVESPSAEVKGHGPGQEQLVWGKRNVKVTRAEPIGTYAVRFIFDDGHSTGLFTWAYLYKLGRDSVPLMAAYAEKLKAAGVGR